MIRSRNRPLSKSSFLIGAFVCIFFGCLFFGCQPRDGVKNAAATDSTAAIPSSGQCDAKKFLFLSDDATIASVIDTLKKQKIPYRSLEREAQACEELTNDNTTGPFGEFFTCPHSAFILVPSLKFILDETKDYALNFQNALLIFHNDRLIKLVLWEDSLHQNGGITSLRSIYSQKYGDGEHNKDEGYGETWVYDNKRDSIRVLFETTHYHSTPNYESMTMMFSGFQSAYNCLSDYRAIELDKSKKEEDKHQKKLFDKI